MPDPDYEPSPMSTRRYIESDRVEGTAVYDAEVITSVPSSA